MGYEAVPAGKDIPNDFNVIIEIPAESDPVKYEVDKDTQTLWVDRFIGTGMRYPLSYGYIPQTLAGDGDPVDALVLAPFPIMAGAVVRCRPVGILKMTDEKGEDAKLIVAPIDKVCPMTADIKSIDQVPQYIKDNVQHFFEQYKKNFVLWLECFKNVPYSHFLEFKISGANFRKSEATFLF